MYDYVFDWNIRKVRNFDMILWLKGHYNLKVIDILVKERPETKEILSKDTSFVALVFVKTFTMKFDIDDKDYYQKGFYYLMLLSYFPHTQAVVFKFMIMTCRKNQAFYKVFLLI